MRRIVQTIIGGTQSLVRFALSLLDACTLLCRETSGLLQFRCIVCLLYGYYRV